MLLLRALVVLSIASLALAAEDGAALYRKNCAGCHDSGAARVPSREALKRLSPERILLALESGTMMIMGARRTDPERHAIAEFLAAKPFGREPLDSPPPSAYCRETRASLVAPPGGPRWNGWGADLANRRFQPAEMAGLSAADLPRLQLKWAFGFPGDIVAYSQPAITGGSLFVGSAGRRVYSLNARTGCIYWTFESEAPVRTAISTGPIGARQAVYFGDLHANVYAVNAATGTLVWKTRVEDHSEARITGAPALDKGRLFVPVASFEEVSAADPGYQCCRFRGSVAALDSATGKIIWKTYTIPETARPTRKNKA